MNEQLKAFAEGLECQNIDEIMEASPEKLRKLGQLIAYLGKRHSKALLTISKSGYPSHFNSKESLVEMMDELVDLAKEALYGDVPEEYEL